MDSRSKVIKKLLDMAQEVEEMLPHEGRAKNKKAIRFFGNHLTRFKIGDDDNIIGLFQKEAERVYGLSLGLHNDKEVAAREAKLKAKAKNPG